MRKLWSYHNGLYYSSPSQTAGGYIPGGEGEGEQKKTVIRYKELFGNTQLDKPQTFLTLTKLS